VVQAPGWAALLQGVTYEKGGVTPHYMGVENKNGRLMVFMTRNCDLGDAFEWINDPRYPAQYGVIDDGKLDLDTPLVKYMPGRYDVGDDPRLDQITARHVLSHTTGFPNWRPRGDKILKMYFTPGNRFSYSGEGFVYYRKS